jgi:excisionase family DNA binding protein
MTKQTAYTLADAARRLGLKPATLRQQIRNGKLIAYKFGRDWIVDDHEVERYALEHRRAR